MSELYYAMHFPAKYSFVSRTTDGRGPHWFIDHREVSETEYEAHIAANTYRAPVPAPPSTAPEQKPIEP